VSRARASSTFLVVVALTIVCAQVAKAGGNAEQDQQAAASSAATPPDHSVLGRLEATGVVVRQSFVGVNAENLPATVSYVDSTLSGHSYLVDLAVKLNGFQPVSRPDQTLLVSPSVEWHRSDRKGNGINKLSAAGNVEYFVKTGAGIRDGLIFQGQASVTREVVGNQTEEMASLLTTLSHKGGPGDHLQYLGYGFYYPYLGFEYFANLPLTQGTTTLAPAVDLAFATGRLYLEIHPFNSKPKGPRRFQLIGTYTYRKRVGGDRDAAQGYGLLELSALYYLDAARRVAIGYTYEDGHNPTNNFLFDRRSSIALKLKLGGDT